MTSLKCPIFCEYTLSQGPIVFSRPLRDKHDALLGRFCCLQIPLYWHLATAFMLYSRRLYIAASQGGLYAYHFLFSVNEPSLIYHLPSWSDGRLDCFSTQIFEIWALYKITDQIFAIPLFSCSLRTPSTRSLFTGGLWLFAQCIWIGTHRELAHKSQVVRNQWMLLLAMSAFLEQHRCCKQQRCCLDMKHFRMECGATIGHFSVAK